MENINLSIIEKAISMVSEMSNSFFEVAPPTAADRKKYEKAHTLYYIGTYKGLELKIDFRCRCTSFGNIYFFKNIYYDEMKKDVRFLKKILREEIINEDN